MVKNFSIFTLLILSVFLSYRLIKANTLIANLSGEIEKGAELITKYNNDKVNDFFYEINSFLKIYGDSSERIREFTVEELREHAEKLRTINNDLKEEIKVEYLLNLAKERSYSKESNVTLIENKSNSKIENKLIRSINIARLIEAILIPFFDNPFGVNPYGNAHYQFCKNQDTYLVKSNDTLKIQVKLSTNFYNGMELFALVDTLDFKKKSWDRGEFVIPVGTFKEQGNNLKNLDLEYFLRDCITNEISKVKRERVKYKIIK